MKVAQAEQMRQIDRMAREDFKIPGAILMERAAWSVLEEIKTLLGSLTGKQIFIFCGKGNNGGDGLALARLLHEAEAGVTIILMYERGQYRGLAGENLERAEKFGVKRLLWSEFDVTDIGPADLLVDALLGTGAAGAPSDVIAASIQAINNSGRPVLAIDLPSGINVDNGQVEGLAVKATRTVTFGLPKPGLLIFPGAGFAGELVVKTIGFPRQLLTNDSIELNCLTAYEAGALLPRREPAAHKGTAGHVVIIGGSPGMTGAVALACLGALRAGCGLATAGLRPGLSFPEKPLEVMAGLWPELRPKIPGFSCIVFGPGLTTQEDGREFLAYVIKQAKIPLVIDADGLNLIAQNEKMMRSFTQPVIITPHPGEMARLTGISVAEIQADRLSVARHYAKEWGLTVILKGARTIIACPDGQTYINITGNPGMATAGMGDVLAGLIGGLISQGMPVTEAGVAGTYLHGLAGDLAARNLGSPGIIAGDLLREIPAATGIIRLRSQETGVCKQF
jgi:NAD(P)H-hydrate epimerase